MKKFLEYEIVYRNDKRTRARITHQELVARFFNGSFRANKLIDKPAYLYPGGFQKWDEHSESYYPHIFYSALANCFLVSYQISEFRLRKGIAYFYVLGRIHPNQFLEGDVWKNLSRDLIIPNEYIEKFQAAVEEYNLVLEQRML